MAFNKKKNNRDVLICGCSKFGAHVAEYYSKNGCDVTVLDVQQKAERKLGDNFGGAFVRGDATDIDVLQANDAEKADVIVACTENDNTNIFICEIASVIFGTKKVFARINDNDKAELFSDLENISVISPFVLSMEKFLEFEK